MSNEKSTPASTFLDKEKQDSLKRDFALHCLLISRQDSVSTTEAKFTAYCEGPTKLADRLKA